MQQSETIISNLTTLCKQPELQALSGALKSDAQLHMVGGTIRSAALQSEKIEVHEQIKTDLDLATVLHPEKIIERLKNLSNVKIIPTGIGHGTLTIVINQHSIEITTFRQPGSRLENSFSTDIFTDLSGRDFTCNAIAFDIFNEKLIDPYNGLAHIKNRQLLAVGSAETRFLEDPLRMLRMVRFGPASDFEVATDLLLAAKQQAHQLNAISPERIRSEFEKILIGNSISKSMRMLLNTGLLEQFLPELLPSVKFEQNDFHIHDVFEHILWVMERAPRNLTVRLAALFHDIGKPQSLSIDERGRRHFYDHEKFSAEICKIVMERMRFSNDMTASVSLLVSMHMRPLVCSDKAVRRIIRDLGVALPEWQALKYADKTPKQSDAEFALEMQSFEEKLVKEDRRQIQTKRSGLVISGQDLIETFSIKPGPNIGNMLKTLEDAILDDPKLNNRDDLLALAAKLV